MQSEVDLLHVLQMKHKKLSSMIVEVGIHDNLPLWKVDLILIAHTYQARFMHSSVEDLAQAHVKREIAMLPSSTEKPKQNFWTEKEKKNSSNFNTHMVPNTALCLLL